jgi:hypothetical protein
MLWYKNWLETWPRVMFLLLWSGIYLLFPAFIGPGHGARNPVPTAPEQLRLISSVFSFPFVFAFVFLAGNGIRTQPSIGPAAHSYGKSSLYTLSLPVSRRRLLLVRAALGLVEMAAVSVALALLFWFLYARANTDMAGMAGHLMKVFACGIGFYFLSTLFATFVEDPFHTIATVAFCTLLMILNSSGWIPGYLNVIGLIGSNGVTGLLTWIQMAACVALGGICLIASIKIVESQEY